MVEGIKAVGIGDEGSGGLPGRDLRKVALARERTVASCVAGSEVENAKCRQREEAAANACRIYAEERNRMNLHPDPQFDPTNYNVKTY